MKNASGGKAGRPRVYFGWWTVLAQSVLSMWAGSFLGVGMSAFFKPMAEDLLRV